jgi:hypothetical protein
VCKIPGFAPQDTFSKAMESTFPAPYSSGNLIEMVEWNTEEVL